MRLYEHEAKALLGRFGIETPLSALVGEAGEAGRLARRLGNEVVIKAQVLSGGRMKAGAIRFASSQAAAIEAVRHVLRVEVGGRLATRALVEQRLQVAREVYAGITWDNDTGQPVLVVTEEGGIDVEEAEGAVIRRHLDPLAPTQNFRIKEALVEAGFSGSDLVDVTTMLSRLWRMFSDLDLLLAEINPLAQTTDGRWLALDCHIEADDDAAFRQQEWWQEFQLEPAERTGREPTDMEVAAARIDRSDHRGVAGRLVEFDGTLGLIIGGGGASLTAFDAVRAHGGSPANYCEIGGNPSVRKVAALTRLLLGNRKVDRVAVIMNIVNNTRADIVARGVIKGCIEAGRDPAETIAVFRVPGAWEEEAARLLEHYRVVYCDRTVSIDEAARRAVAG